MSKNKKKQIKNEINTPAIYPNNRYKDSKSPKPNDENVEIAKKWVEFIKL